jgi:DNA-binding PadR family transcriptional regulator
MASEKPADRGEHLSLELRRGAIVVAILSQLDEPLYGYSLRERLAEQGLEIKEGTLYPMLRRLESQGLLDSDWEVGEGRPRRYYRLSVRGDELLGELKMEWDALVHAMGRLLNKEDDCGSH